MTPHPYPKGGIEGGRECDGADRAPPSEQLSKAMCRVVDTTQIEGTAPGNAVPDHESRVENGVRENHEHRGHVLPREGILERLEREGRERECQEMAAGVSEENS